MWVKKILIPLITFLIFIPHNLGAEDIAKYDLKKQQRELDKINKSINETKSKLNKLNKQEKSTLKSLQANKRHSQEVARLITLLEAQLNELQRQIKVRDSIYYGLSNKLSTLLFEYAELARKVYIEGSTDESEIVFTRKSFAPQLQHEIYYSYLTNFLDSQAKNIDLMRIKVSTEIGQLRDKSDFQQELRGAKRREQNKIAQNINKNQVQLSQIKKDTKVLQAQLNKMMQSASKLKSIIADLIRKETNKPIPKVQKPNAPSQPQTATVNPSGQYPWPVDSRKIYRGYGQQKNRETDTYFDNPGIDIATPIGSSVRNIEDGEVSLIHWLPGYGTLVIMNHGTGLRSVYANLSSVNVRKGDRVPKGAVIGRTGESVDGEFLHFELWSGNSRLNPRNYLR